VTAWEHLTIRPRKSDPQSWAVEDAERRVHGFITRADLGFFIHASKGTRLYGAGLGPYANLADVTRRIADHMAMPCVFSAE
jgi:hypothetical protein